MKDEALDAEILKAFAELRKHGVQVSSEEEAVAVARRYIKKRVIQYIRKRETALLASLFEGLS